MKKILSCVMVLLYTASFTSGSIYADAEKTQETDAGIKETVLPEDLLPAGTLFYCKSPGLKLLKKYFEGTDFLTAARKFHYRESIRNVTKALIDFLELSASKKNVNLQGIMSLLENPWSIALIGFFPVKGKIKPGIVFFFEAQSPETFNSLLKDILTSMHRPVAASGKNVPDLQITSSVSGSLKIYYCTAGTTVFNWAFVDNTAVVASHLPALYSVLNQAAIGYEGSLAHAISFTKITSSIAQMTGPFFYINIASIMGQFGLMLPANIKTILAKAGIYSLMSIGGGMQIRDGGVEHWLFFYAPGKKTGLFSFFTKPLNVPRMVNHFNGNDFICFNLNWLNCYTTILQISESVSGLIQSKIDTALNHLESRLGISIPDDLLPWLGEEVFLSGTPDGMIFRCRIKNTDEFMKVVRLVMIANPHKIETEELFDTSIILHYVKDFKTLKGTIPSFFVHNDTLCFSLTPQPLRALANKSIEKPSAEKSDLLRLIAKAPGSPSLFIYKDIQSGFSSAYKSMIYLLQLFNSYFNADIPVADLPSATLLKKGIFGLIGYIFSSDDGVYIGLFSPVGALGFLVPSRSSTVHITSNAVSAGILAAMVVPAFVRARNKAKNAKRMLAIQIVGQAVLKYAGDHNDVFPASLSILADDGYIENRSAAEPYLYTPPSGQDISNETIIVSEPVETGDKWRYNFTVTGSIVRTKLNHDTGTNVTEE